MTLVIRGIYLYIYTMSPHNLWLPILYKKRLVLVNNFRQRESILLCFLGFLTSEPPYPAWAERDWRCCFRNSGRSWFLTLHIPGTPQRWELYYSHAHIRMKSTFPPLWGKDGKRDLGKTALIPDDPSKWMRRDQGKQSTRILRMCFEAQDRDINGATQVRL